MKREKIRDKVYGDLFISFINFRLPDNYNPAKDSSEFYLRAKVERREVTYPNENKFVFKRYTGNKGLRLDHLLSIRYPPLAIVVTQFVSIGVLEDKASFRFDQAPPLNNHVSLQITDPSVQAQYDVGKSIATETHRLPNGFVNKRVVFMAKFTGVGIACNIITLEDSNAQAFTHKSFTFTTIALSPPKDTSFLIKFFGLTEGDKLELLSKFLLEEEYRN